MPHDRIHKLLHHFQHEHLPEGEQTIAFHCAELARTMVDRLITGDGTQLAAGLQHLLDAKACFERATPGAVNTGGDSSGGPQSPPHEAHVVLRGAEARAAMRDAMRDAALTQELPPTQQGRLQVLAGRCRGEMRIGGVR